MKFLRSNHLPDNRDYSYEEVHANDPSNDKGKNIKKKSELINFESRKLINMNSNDEQRSAW